MPSYNHYFEAITNTSGDSLVGYVARVTNPSTGQIVPIYADINGTPIVAVSGIVNAAVTDNNGNLSLYVEPGTYNLDIFAPDAASFILSVKNVAMNSTKGDTGAPGTQGLQGNPGGNVDSTGPFSALTGQTVLAGTALVRTSGQTRGSALENTALTDADATAYPLGIAKTANNRYFQRDLREVNVCQFGAIGDDATDSLPAFNAAIAYLKRFAALSTTFYAGAYRLRVPAGAYYLGGTLDLKGITLIIEGDGSGMAGGKPTQLRWAADTTGIRIQRFNTQGTGTEPTPTKGADATILRGLCLQGGGGTTGHGIHARARFVGEDLIATGWAQNGIYILAGQGQGGTNEGNANCWQINRARLIANGGSGLWVQGADSNAGCGIGIDASNNGGYGIDDRSFLGNTYVGCHMEGNTGGANQSSGSNARNVFLGCYTEPGQGAARVMAPAIVIGGLQGAGFTSDSTGAVQEVDLSGRIGNTPGFASVGTDPTGGMITAIHGGTAASQGYGSHVHSTKAPAGFVPRWFGQKYSLGYGVMAAYSISGPMDTDGFGSSAPRPLVFIAPQGLSVGGNGTGIQLPDAAAAPTTGSYAKGDWLKNSNPVAGGKFGFVCITAGSPGTWKPFGVIDA